MSENTDGTTEYIIFEKPQEKTSLDEVPQDVKDALRIVNCVVEGKSIIPRS
jgi:hypothetical protein